MFISFFKSQISYLRIFQFVFSFDFLRSHSQCNSDSIIILKLNIPFYQKLHVKVLLLAQEHYFPSLFLSSSFFLYITYIYLHIASCFFFPFSFIFYLFPYLFLISTSFSLSSRLPFSLSHYTKMLSFSPGNPPENISVTQRPSFSLKCRSLQATLSVHRSE